MTIIVMARCSNKFPVLKRDIWLGHHLYDNNKYSESVYKNLPQKVHTKLLINKSPSYSIYMIRS